LLDGQGLALRFDPEMFGSALVIRTVTHFQHPCMKNLSCKRCKIAIILTKLSAEKKRLETTWKHLSLFDDVILNAPQSHQCRLATVFLVDSVEPLTPFHFALQHNYSISIVFNNVLTHMNTQWRGKGTLWASDLA